MQDSISTRQGAILAGFGAVLWFLAALLMRAIEPLGAFHGDGLAVLYVLVVPGTAPFVVLAQRLAGGSAVYGVAVGTAAAALLDGLALALAPDLYGADPRGAGAAILWGVGVGLILALIMDERTRR